jgi:hypothetical protein
MWRDGHVIVGSNEGHDFSLVRVDTLLGLSSNSGL